MCGKSHRLMSCYQFLKQSLEERKNLVQNKKLGKKGLKGTNLMHVHQSLPAVWMAAYKNTTFYSTKAKQTN